MSGTMPRRKGTATLSSATVRQHGLVAKNVDLGPCCPSPRPYLCEPGQVASFYPVPLEVDWTLVLTSPAAAVMARRAYTEGEHANDRDSGSGTHPGLFLPHDGAGWEGKMATGPAASMLHA